MSRGVDEIKNLRFIIEYKGYVEKPINGIYIIPSTENVREWHGIIFPHQGFYMSGIFKFVISFPLQSPEKPPQLKFCTPIYHPLVDPITLELNLRAKFQTWNPLIQCEDPKCPSRDVLLYLKNVLLETNYWENRTHCFNKNAYNAYVQWKRHLELLKHEQTRVSTIFNSEEFPNYVKQCVDGSIDSMYRSVKGCDRFTIQLDESKRPYEVNILKTIKNFQKHEDVQELVKDVKLEIAGFR